MEVSNECLKSIGKIRECSHLTRNRNRATSSRRSGQCRIGEVYISRATGIVHRFSRKVTTSAGQLSNEADLPESTTLSSGLTYPCMKRLYCCHASPRWHDECQIRSLAGSAETAQWVHQLITGHLLHKRSKPVGVSLPVDQEDAGIWFPQSAEPFPTHKHSARTSLHRVLLPAGCRNRQSTATPCSRCCIPIRQASSCTALR